MSHGPAQLADMILDATAFIEATSKAPHPEALTSAAGELDWLAIEHRTQTNQQVWARLRTINSDPDLQA